MSKKDRGRRNTKRRKRERRRLKAIRLRWFRRKEKGHQFKKRELELSKRTRAQIVKEGAEIAERKKRKKAEVA